jgi:hypothetical protein
MGRISLLKPAIGFQRDLAPRFQTVLQEETMKKFVILLAFTCCAPVACLYADTKVATSKPPS